MIYGFIDESGSPGIAISENDYFLVSLVLFKFKTEIKKSEAATLKLKKHLGLTEDYEFHFSKNSSLSRVSFIRLLDRLNFRFVTVSIKKDNSKRTASYGKIAELLVAKIQKLSMEEIKIEMDTNPLLYISLKKQFKLQGVESIRIRQAKSHTSTAVQIADYVVGLSAKKLKKPALVDWYEYVADKEIR